MIVSFSPVTCLPRTPKSLTVSKVGDVLTINGEVFDFTDLPDGATIPKGMVPCEFIVGPVERIADVLQLTLLLPHGPNPSPAVAFPSDLIDPPDGPLAIPFDPEPAEEPIDVEA
ncbi:hypothetical protein C7441_1164 [Pseudaminobacter salicylatoxidans]|uniref:Uncharacterized protein n=1 Tax=Pseudaminobacter salicylatoxidans TaxID=93369 RepID=A0A316BVP4_PSESE|nr:hypothetical protein [Pseudaminobacter salicylatoxidans]PWJ78339.1 hypothetical protein C7441_1164 [Pseudaminobacter salicylatoxidans]